MSTTLQRIGGALALLTIAFAILLQGKPYFTNAARPARGIPSPGVALQMARNLDEVDDVLGDAPSPDREVMRVKQYIDFGFIASYTALFLVLAWMLSRQGGWARVAGTAAIICALATAFFDVTENIAILRILDVPLRRTTPAMINAIRSASAAKWALSAVTLGLISVLFWRQPAWFARVIGASMLLSAALIFYGFADNRFFVYQGYPAFIALAGIVVTFFRLR
ncbi:MAG: hypothetical protein JO307_21495 [Bryobacterales bacterium]|nr:hypothetical protein [Bryobacterales bacterium]MBV9399774.1 hypothetical protein [Bryobacterales bacterium]